MADGKNKDEPKWTLKFNPFKVLGVSSNDPEPDEIRKAYLSQIRINHPDKVSGGKKAALAKKLTAAYSFLKSKDVDKLKEFAKSFHNTNTVDGLVDGDLSHVLEDKTKSEHYRRLFNAHVQIAKETHFKDNFQSFYSQVFDNVSTQPDIDSVNSYYCTLCDEDFIHVEHHVEMIYSPYKEYLTTDAEPGFWNYLEGIFDKEAVNWTPAIDRTGNWTQEKFSLLFEETCEYYRIEKHCGSIGKAVNKSLLDRVAGKNTSAVMSFLNSKINEPVENIFASIIPLLPSSPEVSNLIYDDLIFLAFLKEEKDFKDWKKFALEVSSIHPRMAVIMACVESSLNPQKTETFYDIGLNMIKCQSNFDYAHLCFLLDSCDLNYVANKILTLSSHIECKQLAAYYLIKTNDLSKLESLGKEAVEKGNVYAAHVFYLALIKHHFNKRAWNNVIRTLAQVLPINKLWKAVQALVTDLPELCLNCEAVAELAINKILKSLVSVSPMEIFLKTILGQTSMSTSISVSSIRILCGALHILYGDEERYSKFKDDVLQRLKYNFDAILAEGNVEFLFAAARMPEISLLFKDILQQKKFLERDSVKAQPGINYHASLLAVRGVYNYKTKHFSEMTSDFANAAMNTNKTIADSIASFLSSNPMIHEKILKSATKQFERLQTYIDDYTGLAIKESSLPEILQNVFVNEEPHLSTCYVVSHKNGIDLQNLEKDILGREDNDDEENRGIKLEVKDLAEKAYSYVNLEVICKAQQETICCLTMAAQYFYKSMLATPEASIPEKFGYLGLILECCLNQLRSYTNIFVLNPSTALHALRTMLSFIFRANQHFSEILRKNRKHDGTVNFIDEDCIKQQTDDWQSLLNIRTICPIIVSEIFTIAEGRFALQFIQALSYSTIKEKIRSELYSSNTPKFMYHHALFNAVWSECLSPEETEYEEPIPDVAPLMLQVEKIDDNMDSKEEKLRKQTKNDEILKEKEKIEKLQRKLEETPLVDRMGFRLSRENSIIVLAELYGYEIEEVEMMMNWQRIRRTPDGFINTSNRTLNFDSEQAYTKFLGIQLNQHTKEVKLLLEPAVSGDPQRPSLFSSVDLVEIFGNKILGGFVSFDEMITPPPNKVPDYVSLLLPYHPFFKLTFAGATSEGSNKESICGSNFLMTLYHLDLLAKIFTTGQEVGANFPFSFLNTENNLLKTLNKELQETLKPIGTRKKARLLRRLEYIHRFWFSVEEVEQEVLQASPSNPTTVIKFGNVSVVLKTMPMFRDKNGGLADAKNEFDEDSPEVKFVQDFNEKIHLIEKEFPIIQRIKELAKISACLSILLSNKDNISSIKDLLSVKLPPTRPYSKCGKPGQPCNCCDWVPSVFNYMKVTDEQKLEYLFEKRFSRPYDSAIAAEKFRCLGFHEQDESDQRSMGLDSEQSAKKESRHSQNEAGTSNPMLDIGKYDRLEKYRCYGGVIFQPQPKNVTGIRPSANQSCVNWGTVLDAALFGAQFVPLLRLPVRGISTARMLMRAAKSGNGSAAGKGGGGNKSGEGSGSGGRSKSDGRSKSGGGRGGGPEIDFPENDSQTKHIFRDQPNHLQDTPANRELLLNVANRGKILGTDKFGNTWTEIIMKNGKQAWVSSRGNTIQNGGINETPRLFNPETGLSSHVKPR